MPQKTLSVKLARPQMTQPQSVGTEVHVIRPDYHVLIGPDEPSRCAGRAICRQANCVAICRADRTCRRGIRC